MNIKGLHFCSRCSSAISDEIVCPLCGHDPEEKYDPHLMEEGTLLSDQRYRVGVLIKEDPLYCYYGGWDYLKEKPVIIKELYPRDLIFRNTIISDYTIVQPEQYNEYKNMLNDFIETGKERMLIDIEDEFVCNGFGYHIINHDCLFELL